MESFHWDKHFETGLKEVDEQHHVLVDLINRFGEMLTQIENVTIAELESLLGELAAYAQYHFQNEDDMMTKIGLDSRHVQHHLKLHASFLQEVTRLQQSIAQDIDAGESLLKFLVYWLAFHILGTDQSMSRQIFAIESGTSPEQAFDAEQIIKESATEPLLEALSGLFHLISERNRDLLILNRTLEDKVEQRTAALSEANKQLEQIALTDVLTGLPNRRHAMSRFTQMWSESTLDGTGLACMMIDADNFKQINDNYGHDSGDEVLRQLSRQLRYAVRTDDVVCRLGGDEFLIICPCTSLDGAMQVAEAMRLEVSKLNVVVNGGAWSGSVSVGVAVRTDATQTPEDLIKAADEGVYIAKNKGRNCVGCSNSEAIK
ncbi:MAG: GGDEF domain-containing protein [Gallionellaceae bacterium]